MYLLVEWVHENPKSYTVVPIEQIADGTLRKSKCLVGKRIGIQWKRRVHQALVIDAGKDEQELERTADELAEKQLVIESKCSGFGQSKRCKPNTVMEMDTVACSSRTVQNKDATGKSGAKRRRMERIQTILDQVDTNVINESLETSKVTVVDIITEDQLSKTESVWEEKYLACKTKLRALRSKYKALKASHSNCSEDDESEEIWEGSEVKLRRSEISALMTMSPSITFFCQEFVPSHIHCG